MTVDNIDDNEYVCVYSNIQILESRNKNIKKGDEMDQISIGTNINYENKDGTKYNKK